MKSEKILTPLYTALIAFCMGFGGGWALVSGLGLSVSLISLGICCGIAALGFALCFLHPKGGRSGGVFLLLLIFPLFWDEMRALGARIFIYLEMAYGLQAPGFLEDLPVNTVFLPVLFLSCGAIFVTVWVMSRCCSCCWAAIAGILPMVPCILVTDTVPGSFSLGLWLVGFVLLVLTQELRRRSPEQAARLTTMLLLPGVLGVLVLFLAVPRNTTPKLPDPQTLVQKLGTWLQGDEGGSEDAAEEKLQDSVDLTQVGKRNPSQTPVMEVTSDFSTTLYLRERDYNLYTGLGWNSEANRQEKLVCPTNHSPLGMVNIDTLVLRSYFFVPNNSPQATSLSEGYAVNFGVIRYAYPIYAYPPDVSVYYPDPSTGESVDASYLALPAETELALRSWLEQRGPLPQNTYDIANRIGDMVSELAPYDLNTAPMPQDETDFALWFLENGETGYCVHFATTAAALLRAADIPARYVEGYMVRVTEDEPLLVRESMAHAWVEYYISGTGWVILDPTPSGSQPEEPATEPEPSGTDPTRSEIHTTPTVTTAPNTSEFCPDTDSGACELPEEPALPDWVGTLLLWLLGAVLLILIFLGQRMLRRNRKLNRQRSGPANAQALERYREAVLLAKLLKKPVPPKLTELAQKAKFSRHTLTGEELKQFDVHLTASTQALKRANLWKRFLAKWIYAAY